jgi:hypothetical protein
VFRTIAEPTLNNVTLGQPWKLNPASKAGHFSRYPSFLNKTEASFCR